MEHKGEKLQALADNNQRYYPKDAKGGVDEWGAVIKFQQEIYQKQQQDMQNQKQSQARAYGDELQAAMRQKKAEQDVERRNRLGERDNMLYQVAQKG